MCKLPVKLGAIWLTPLLIFNLNILLADNDHSNSKVAIEKPEYVEGESIDLLIKLVGKGDYSPQHSITDTGLKISLKKDNTNLSVPVEWQEGISHRCARGVAIPGRSYEYRLNLRKYFAFPANETGKYTIEGEICNVKIPKHSFTIKKFPCAKNQIHSASAVFGSGESKRTVKHNVWTSMTKEGKYRLYYRLTDDTMSHAHKILFESENEITLTTHKIKGNDNELFIAWHDTITVHCLYIGECVYENARVRKAEIKGEEILYLTGITDGDKVNTVHVIVRVHDDEISRVKTVKISATGTGFVYPTKIE